MVGTGKSWVFWLGLFILVTATLTIITGTYYFLNDDLGIGVNMNTSNAVTGFVFLPVGLYMMCCARASSYSLRFFSASWGFRSSSKCFFVFFSSIASSDRKRCLRAYSFSQSNSGRMLRLRSNPDSCQFSEPL
jgi:hypothetical protein